MRHTAIRLEIKIKKRRIWTKIERAANKVETVEKKMRDIGLGAIAVLAERRKRETNPRAVVCQKERVSIAVEARESSEGERWRVEER